MSPLDAGALARGFSFLFPIDLRGMFYGIQAGSKTVTQLWGRGVAHIYAFEPSPPRPPTCRKYSVAQSAERIQPTRPQPQPPSPSSVPIPPTPQRRRPDPFLLLAPQLSELRLSLLSLLESGHPALSEITRYYFLHPSKQIRPLIILLFSHATNGLGRQWDRKLANASGRLERLEPEHARKHNQFLSNVLSKTR